MGKLTKNNKQILIHKDIVLDQGSLLSKDLLKLSRFCEDPNLTLTERPSKCI